MASYRELNHYLDLSFDFNNENDKGFSTSLIILMALECKCLLILLIIILVVLNVWFFLLICGIFCNINIKLRRHKNFCLLTAVFIVII